MALFSSHAGRRRRSTLYRRSAYTRASYQTVLDAHGLTASISGTGNGYDSPVAEISFATDKQELLLETRFAARRAVIYSIEISDKSPARIRTSDQSRPTRRTTSRLNQMRIDASGVHVHRKQW